MQTEVRTWFLTTNASLDISTFQIMHVHNYKGTKTELLTNPTMMKGWQDVFGTTSRKWWKRSSGRVVQSSSGEMETV